MSRRAVAILVALLVGFVASLAAGCSDEARTAERSQAARPGAIDDPNVVLIVIDDMAWEDLTSTPVPVLDGLMQRGRVFSNFYVCPTCSPSRAALQFGRYSYRDGVYGVIFARERRNRGVPLDRIAMPEVLGPAGYSTALFGKWHVSTENEVTLDTAALEHGYDTWLAGAATNIGLEGEASHSDWLRVDDGRVRHSKAYDALAITKAFAEWWQKPATQPRFAVVSYLTPHEPFTPPPADLLPPGVAPVDALADARTRYEAALSALDTLIGRVVAQIDLTNTYVFVFPDNGTPSLVPPPGGRYQGYKGTTFQGGVHVPLIVLGPDVPSGTCTHLTHVVDVPRTVFELCGAPSASGFEDSRSFAPSVRGEDEPPRAPVFLHHRAPNSAVGPFERDLWAVVDAEGWKLTSEGGRLELFDLTKDDTQQRTSADATRRARLAAVAQEILAP
jgi:arylsulfatase A-like enzyme